MATRVEGVERLQRRLGLLSTEVRKMAQREVLRSVLNIQAGAKRRAPVDTGRLRNSITFELAPDGLSATIGTNVEYAPAVEFGSKPHVIRPRNKRVLRFKVGGKFVFARAVNHPGGPAQPFLFPAFEEERPMFRRRLEDAIEQAGRRAAGR